jgi:hypothetical protein
MEDDCHRNVKTYTEHWNAGSSSSASDMALAGCIRFTNAQSLTVKELEIFELTD